jgi:hypothetical protein
MPASIQHVCVVYSRWVVITAFLSYFLERCEEKGGIDDGSLRVDSMGKKKIKNKTKKQGGDIFHSRAHISFSFSYTQL